MTGPSDPSSYGFFGSGYWGRKVFWENIPVKHRNLDTEGYLENLLKVFGDECESFLNQITNLPLQREPYSVRAKDGEEEWFYFTEAFSYEDAYWGDVIRLVGEKVYANMPNHDEDDTPTSDADELEQWWGWWPYAPISKVARWWKGTWDNTTYDVVRVRTRSFDWTETPYNAASSQANEVWLRGGDLQIFFDYLSDDITWRDDWTSIGTGDGSVSPTVSFPYLPVRIEYNDSPSAIVWLTANAKLRVRLDLTVGGTDFDLYDVPDGTVDETGNLYPQSIDASNSGATISFALSGDTITITDTAGLFTVGMVGHTIRITGTSLNNGVFDIVSYVDANNLTYINQSGSTEAVSIGKAWEVGDGEIDTATSYGTINYQIGKIEIDLTAAGDTVVADSDIIAKWYVKGYYLSFYPPRVIDYLARDFGFLNDKNDPEDVQRSTIANITKYHGLKASQDSYRIRGEISLFTVVARALWYMCDLNQWSSLPSARKFSHHGLKYTDIDPRRIRFDDIYGDQQFYDPDTTAWVTVLDNELMYEESTGDGYSIGLAYALDVAQGYYGKVSPFNSTARDPASVTSTVSLSDTESESYGFQAGYRVVVRMMRCQSEAFNWSKGMFGLSEYRKANSEPAALDDDVLWVDNVVSSWSKTVTGATTEEDIGEWVVIIGVGKDADGNPYDGPVVGHSDITAVNQGLKTFTISGDHTGTIVAGEQIAVLRSTGNDGNYTVQSATLSGSDTDVVVVEVIPSAVADGEMGWVDVAIRYWPEIDFNNCCFCKSYKMSIGIEPTAEAYEFYDTDDKLDSAIERMRNKIAPSNESYLTIRPSLIPIHTRVVDWAITKSWTLNNVYGGSTIDMELTDFVSYKVSDVSAVSATIFTIRGDKRSVIAAGDGINIFNSTGNDGSYTVSSVTMNSNGDDTDVAITTSIPTTNADGSMHLMPSRILMTVDQRGDMSPAGPSKQQTMKVYDDNPSVVWSDSQSTGASDAITWYNVVTDYDITSDIGNNTPVKIEATGTAAMTYGDVRFTFTISKYVRQ